MKKGIDRLINYENNLRLQAKTINFFWLSPAQLLFSQLLPQFLLFLIQNHKWEKLEQKHK